MSNLYKENKISPQTIPGSFTVNENHIGSAVSEILCYRQKSFLLYIIGFISKLKGVGVYVIDPVLEPFFGRLYVASPP